MAEKPGTTLSVRETAQLLSTEYKAVKWLGRAECSPEVLVWEFEKYHPHAA